MKNKIHTLGMILMIQKVDNKVDINRSRVTRYGRVFGIQEFNINQIEDPWFGKIIRPSKIKMRYLQILYPRLCVITMISWQI